MFTVTRKEGEGFFLITPDGTEIRVKYLGNRTATQARIGVEAPDDCTILRFDQDGEIEPGQRER